MSTQTYSPEDVEITINGNIIGGYADGTFVTIEREADAYTKIVGADGEVTRTRNANKSGSLTLTLKQTSDSHAVLMALQNADETDDSSIFPVYVRDNLGYEYFAEEGWIRKTPNAEYGAELSNREWLIDLAKIAYIPPSI